MYATIRAGRLAAASNSVSIRFNIWDWLFGGADWG